MTSRFIQIHFLTSYPAALLNRDDAGMAKRIPFGGASRIRVSSQCMKRHWRRFEGDHALVDLVGADMMSVRSRRTFEQHLVEPLIASGVDAAIAREVTGLVMSELLGESAKSKAKATGREEGGDDAGEAAYTNQITILGRPELAYLLDLAKTIARRASASAGERHTSATANEASAAKAGKKGKATAKGDSLKDAIAAAFTKEAKENLRTMRLGAGLDAALFGRMVTSDVLSREDAAIHVAHAFTVHAEASEADYFTAVDDLLMAEEGGELGSGHINSSELTSGLFYGYVVIDVPLLVSNLEGGKRSEWQKADLSLARKVVESMVHLVAKVSPGAKLGSTAPYAFASLVLVESGTAQPRTLANAFLEPVSERPALLANAYRAISQHIVDLDRMYGASSARRGAALGDRGALAGVGAEWSSLDELAAWAGAQVGA